MSIQSLDAANAYGRAIHIGRDIADSPAVSPAAMPEGTDFGGMVQQFVGDAATALHGAETASARQVAGKGDLIDVVTAMGAAETALDTVVAVRDRMVGAYSDIMRMQI